MRNPIDTHTGSPTEELILDLLIARRRLGEVQYSISRRNRQALERLARAGLLTYRDGLVEGYYLASLDDAHWKKYRDLSRYVAPRDR